MEQETGALFRELSGPGEATVNSSLYQRKLAHESKTSQEALGGLKVDASPCLNEWIKRHNEEHELHRLSPTPKAPLQKLLKGKVKFSVSYNPN